MTFQPNLLAFCRIYRLVPQLDDSNGPCDPRSKRRYLQSLIFAALLPLIETPGDHECEELAVLECIGCELCISTAGAGITCTSAQHRSVLRRYIYMKG